MQPRTISSKRNGWSQYAVATGFVCLIAARADAQTLLRHDFNDDILGLAPNGPQLGGRPYRSGLLTLTHEWVKRPHEFRAVACERSLRRQIVKRRDRDVCPPRNFGSWISTTSM